MEVLKKLEGAYALLFKSIHYPGQLVACKRGSPLIMGIKVRRLGRQTWKPAQSGACGSSWRAWGMRMAAARCPHGGTV